MKRELELELQAWLDGELSPRDARRLESRLDEDAQARALAEELKWTKTALTGHEPELAVPETREFYWSKIEREIQRRDEAGRHAGPLAWWLGLLSERRWAATLSTAAAAVLLLLGVVTFYDVEVYDAYPRYLAQVDSPSEEMSAVSYRSRKESVFVLWLSDQAQEPSGADYLLNDMVIQ